MRTITLFTLLLLMTAAHADSPTEFRDTGENVILLMSDGVRWQEFFSDSPPALPKFWSQHASEGIIYGAPGSPRRINVANSVRVSLPAYESILAGRVLPNCLDNDNCELAPIAIPTFLERLVHAGLKKEEVAVFGSWNQIATAAEHVPGTAMVNAGITPMADVEHPELIATLNTAQVANHPTLWGAARSDRDTVAQAMHYLEFHRPRFMFISLNDTDEWGHRAAHDSNGFQGYLKALGAFDDTIDQLIRKLGELGDYGRKTTLIVTTDHGRGNTPERFPNHGKDIPESGKIWLYIRGPHVNTQSVPMHVSRHSHIDICPTVEILMGLCQKPWPLRKGVPFREALRLNAAPRSWACPGHANWVNLGL